MKDFEQRIDAVKDKVGMSDLDSNFTRTHGTVNCPFCGNKGKGWITNNSWFRCFKSSCEVKGDVIKIYQLLNNYPNYANALYGLEQEYGLTYEFRNLKYDERDHILNEVLDIYQEQLMSHPDVYNYLLSRGINESTIQNLKIGYAPQENKFLGCSELNFSKLIEHKLLNYRYKDFFCNRIIFPINNRNSALVHLSGRWYGDLWDECPKYKDTLTVPYIGSSKQYLLFEDYIDRFKNRGSTIVLSEGIPDTIVLNQQGVPALGLLGLEKITSHVDKLKEFKNIIAIFDTDKFDDDHPNHAGELKSWIRVVPQLLNLQCMLPVTNFFTYTVPNGKDLNDYYLSGVNDLGKAIDEGKQSFIDNLIHQWGPDIGKHASLLRLINSTGKGTKILEQYIDESDTPLEYAIKIFGG